ncbi:hypothetical protein AWC38_SpisGene21625 [Stylophora pistillata]|uniref:CCHC-type domain-containing protein n=1 Tax=Stylophora pistillata TaxID=50429 RepID=A0A2B4RBQ2_STYPI|nr:hypothetical protein AWC38_SpisGene21625 [Stylophora pistillata]
MRNFYEAHDKYHAELIDGSAIPDSIEYFESVKRVGTAVFQSFYTWSQSAEFKLQEELDLAISLHPKDSISNIGSVNSKSAVSSRRPKTKSTVSSTISRLSTASSARLRACAKKAALSVEASAVRTRQDIQLQELLLKQKKENFELETELAKAETEEKYSDFVRAFENLIESKTSSPNSRLYYLVQYTSGEVKELMQSCLSMYPAKGYKTSRALLKDRYGESYKIATALIDQVKKSPQIKADDGPALQRYSVLLTSFKNSLQEIGYLSKIENPDTLQKIIGRLPFGLRQRWREKADHITADLKREVTIGDIAEFVEAKARIANHPVFGNIYSNEDKNTAAGAGSKRRHRTPSKEHKSSAFTTHGTTPESPTDPPKDDTENVPKKSNVKCPLCKESHRLSRCQLFRGKSVDERISFVRSSGLCDNCLVAGHMAMSCPKQSYCQIVGCKIGHRKHSTFLHQKNDKPAKTEPASPSETQSSNIDNEKQNDRARSCFTEVVACEGTCSATGAGASATGLAIVPVNVRTKAKEKMVQTYAFLYPGSNTTFCTNKLIERLGTSGSDERKALEPQEVQRSEDGGPYAVRTLLGWTINGPLDASSEGYGAVSYLRVVNEAKNVHCAFLMGKSRQTPQKAVTIPRLELSAAVVATRLNSSSSLRPGSGD